MFRESLLQKSNVWDSSMYNPEITLAQELCKPLIHSHNAKNSERILDIGCGEGLLTNYLSEYLLNAAEIIGVDNCESKISLAKNKAAENVFFIQQDITNNNLNLGKFDAIFSFYSFQWIENQHGLIENINILLKSNCPLYLQLFPPLTSFHILIDNLKKLISNNKWKNRNIDFRLPNQMNISTLNQYVTLLMKHNFLVIEAIEKNHIELLTRQEFFDNLKMWLPHININIFMEEFIYDWGELILAETNQSNRDKIWTSFPYWIVKAKKQDNQREVGQP